MDQLGAYFKALKPYYDDDSADRLNYYYTPCLILLFAITLSAKAYVGQPIQCYLPAQFKGPWCDYTERYCFIENTYWTSVEGIILAFAITLSAKQYVGQPVQCFVPAQFQGAWEAYTERFCFIENTYWSRVEDRLPSNITERDRLEMNYYQWVKVPFVLALQALMFYFPIALWQWLNWQSGLNVKAIVGMATETKTGIKADMTKDVETISQHIGDACNLQQDLGDETMPVMWLFGCAKYKGLYVCSLYLFVKCLFIANVVGQFFILNSFIGSDYTFWGAEIIRDLFSNYPWKHSGHFPRVTFCDVQVRVLGNLHRWTVQCVLMINMFNEKIYLFLWWWFLIVAIFTVANTLWWIGAMFFRESRRTFIRKYVVAAKNFEGSAFERSELEHLNTFIRRRLQPDGVFVLRLISFNAGDVITTWIVDYLWKEYKKNQNRVAYTPPARRVATESPNHA